MKSPAEILPGVIFYSYLSSERKEKACVWNHHTLVMQVSGQMILETAEQKLTISSGNVLLIHKNQLGNLTKTPDPGGHYETIVISLQEDLMRKIALEEKMKADRKYIDPKNLVIPNDDFLNGYFQSIIPYARSSGSEITDEMGLLKVKEGIKLIMLAVPELRNFLFDFSDPYKIDLEKFMLRNYHFNVPVKEFSRLTGRSLSGFKRDFQKTFGMPPRKWLQEKRLTEARHLIEHKNKRPSSIYLELGFESLSHFSQAFKKKYGKAPNLS